MALTPEARRTFTRLFGTEPTPHPTDPELLEILQNEIFGEVFATPGLTDAERDDLRRYLGPLPGTRRLGRHRFLIGDREVDFAPALHGTASRYAL